MPSELAGQSTEAWQRYYPEMVLEFDAPITVVDRRGQGRMTRTQDLRVGELFCYLPPLPSTWPERQP